VGTRFCHSVNIVTGESRWVEITPGLFLLEPRRGGAPADRKVDCGSHSDPITNIWCKLSCFRLTEKLLRHPLAECLFANLLAPSYIAFASAPAMKRSWSFPSVAASYTTSAICSGDEYVAICLGSVIIPMTRFTSGS